MFPFSKKIRRSHVPQPPSELHVFLAQWIDRKKRILANALSYHIQRLTRRQQQWLLALAGCAAMLTFGFDLYKGLSPSSTAPLPDLHHVQTPATYSPPPPTTLWKPRSMTDSTHPSSHPFDSLR